ncbi:alpha/beta hydrolase-fold protein [Roseivirga echinicomitans]|uniref:Uncharacterized protein n=1 Tax=Roseivirga echinicomitans TaxID=296218 RepID=A0A150XKA5_9BACT|nr:alpha/beta hydrolase-fold protein [Roseivirga echinicomitans]KYG79140.1 hypothetical protein AWN68_17890 [Roseivirga echinicomitans]
MKKTIIVIISLFTVLYLQAQKAETNNIVGTNHFIDSEILEETKQIQVYLPPGYSETDKDYPVLYLLDGQQLFTYAVSLSNTFKQFDLTPDFIIVGINTPYRQRYANYINGTDNFIGFMGKELIPYVEKSFRVNDEKLLFGWQYAGSLGFDIMLNKTIPFDAYFIASPFPIKDKVAALDSITITNKALYFAVSPNEYEVNHGTNKLDSLLSIKKISGLDWSYFELVNEEHQSTAYPTLYHSLRTYFKYYPEFQVNNLQAFIGNGGLEYAYAHTKQRALIYGAPPELPTWSKYTIIRSAIRAEDYPYFESFANTFFSDEFIRDLGNRALDIVNYYEAHAAYNKAIEIYKSLLIDSPDSESLLTRTGNAYLALGNKVEADKYFKRAKEVTK